LRRKAGGFPLCAAAEPPFNLPGQKPQPVCWLSLEINFDYIHELVQARAIMIERPGRRNDGFIGGSVNAQLRFGLVTDNIATLPHIQVDLRSKKDPTLMSLSRAQKEMPHSLGAAKLLILLAIS